MDFVIAWTLFGLRRYTFQIFWTMLGRGLSFKI